MTKIGNREAGDAKVTCIYRNQSIKHTMPLGYLKWCTCT